MAITVDDSLHNDVLLSVMREQLIKSNQKLDCEEDRRTSKRLISAIERVIADDFAQFLGKPNWKMQKLMVSEPRLTASIKCCVRMHVIRHISRLVN